MYAAMQACTNSYESPIQFDYIVSLKLAQRPDKIFSKFKKCPRILFDIHTSLVLLNGALATSQNNCRLFSLMGVNVASSIKKAMFLLTQK
jgi:hypothetical protein